MKITPRSDWFESMDTINISLFVKNIDRATLSQQQTETSLSLEFSDKKGLKYKYAIEKLNGKIKPYDGSLAILSTKADLILNKKTFGKWKSLEKVESPDDVVVSREKAPKLKTGKFDFSLLDDGDVPYPNEHSGDSSGTDGVKSAVFSAGSVLSSTSSSTGSSNSKADSSANTSASSISKTADKSNAGFKKVEPKKPALNGSKKDESKQSTSVKKSTTTSKPTSTSDRAKKDTTTKKPTATTTPTAVTKPAAKKRTAKGFKVLEVNDEYQMVTTRIKQKDIIEALVKMDSKPKLLRVEFKTRDGNEYKFEMKFPKATEPDESGFNVEGDELMIVVFKAEYTYWKKPELLCYYKNLKGVFVKCDEDGFVLDPKDDDDEDGGGKGGKKDDDDDDDEGGKSEQQQKKR
ncbi:unnamed protein product [Ambrosiozyma monospora]|uniref:Unnamed protein product n=1 Tax=Ambrosiozyma monospora TaxID=43982 RepID=A0ACB5TKR4_AMBMO|nr:unnamed protein product [Ambrosiozyma monospora]